MATVRTDLMRYSIKVFVFTAAAQTLSAFAGEFIREQALFRLTLV